MSRQHHRRSSRYTPPKRPTRATLVPPGVGPYEHWANLGCTCEPEVMVGTTIGQNGNPLIVLEAGHHPGCESLPRIRATEN